jgi:hypothetical protein
MQFNDHQDCETSPLKTEFHSIQVPFKTGFTVTELLQNEEACGLEFVESEQTGHRIYTAGAQP